MNLAITVVMEKLLAVVMEKITVVMEKLLAVVMEKITLVMQPTVIHLLELLLSLAILYGKVLQEIFEIAILTIVTMQLFFSKSN